MIHLEKNEHNALYERIFTIKCINLETIYTIKPQADTINTIINHVKNTSTFQRD